MRRRVVVDRGGYAGSVVLVSVWHAGCVCVAWTGGFALVRWMDAFAAEGLDADALATAPRDPGAPLPWDHISAGVEKGYLLEERGRALAAEATPDCSFEGCTACGVCPSLGVDIVLAGGSRG